MKGSRKGRRDACAPSLQVKEMRNRRLIAGILAVLALSPAACAEQTRMNIRELRAAMPEKWECEIITDGGETVSVSAPVRIPDAEVFPVSLCDVWFDMEDEDSKAGDEKFLFGKADNRKRIKICNPAEFPEMETSVEDVIAFLKQKLAETGREGIEMDPHGITWLGRMCKTKPYRWKSEDGKVGFPISVADPEKPWKNDNACGWEFDVAQRMYGIPLFMENYLQYGNDYYNPGCVMGNGYVCYIDEDHYYMWMTAVKEAEVLEPDAAMIPPEKLFSILEERIRKGRLQYILGIELGYFCFDCVSAVKIGLIDETEHPYVIIPVWEVRGYDTIMKDIWHDHCATCSLEEDVLYDMDYVYRLLYDARTGEQVDQLYLKYEK